MDYNKAIRILKNERECVGRDCDRDCASCDLVMETEDVLEALNLAIGCVQNRAYREMRKVIDGLKDLIIDRMSFAQEPDDVFSRDIQILERAVALIQSMQSQNPEHTETPVIHAHWTNTTRPDEDDYVERTCSNCLHTDRHYKELSVPYCWYCGAKMDEVVKYYEAD